MIVPLVTLSLATCAFVLVFLLAGSPARSEGKLADIRVPGVVAAAVLFGSLAGGALGSSVVAFVLPPDSDKTTLWRVCAANAGAAIGAAVPLRLTLGSTFFSGLFPCSSRRLGRETGLVLVGYVLARAAVDATHCVTVEIASRWGYHGPVGHPALKLLVSCGDPWARTVLLASVCLVGPLAEELLFRTTLVGWLTQHVHAAAAALASGLVFSLFHEPAITRPAMFVFGALLAWSYTTMKSLYIPLGLHIAFNVHSVLVALWQ